MTDNLCPCEKGKEMRNACYYGEALTEIEKVYYTRESLREYRRFFEPSTDEILLSLYPSKPLSNSQILDSLVAQGTIRTPYRVCVDATKSTLKQDVVMLFNLALAAAFVPISKLTKREMRL
jgi:hypothetical protein